HRQDRTPRRRRARPPAGRRIPAAAGCVADARVELRGNPARSRRRRDARDDRGGSRIARPLSSPAATAGRDAAASGRAGNPHRSLWFRNNDNIRNAVRSIEPEGGFMTSTGYRRTALPCIKILAAAVGMSWIASSAGAADDVPDLSGVWQFGTCGDGGGFNLRCMILEEDDELLTDRAKAYRDAIDEAAQPKYDCAPMSVPHLWTDPYAYRLEQLEDRVLIHYGKDDVTRTVWLEGHGHEEPAVNEFFYFGHSTGRYEGDALVVTTDRFVF